MTQGQYAQHRRDRGLPGVNQPAVSKAIASGRLSQALVHHHGSVWIDPDMADEEWAANTRGKGRPPVGQERTKRNGMPLEVDELVSEGGQESLFPSLADSTRRKAQYEAKIKQLEYERRAGELARVEPLRAEAQRLATMTSQAVMQVPDRIAAQVAAEADEMKVRKLMEGELRKALETLVEWSP